MGKKVIIILLFILCLTGCDTKKYKEIEYEDNEIYAVAYLGYNELTNLELYEEYVDINCLNTYYLSTGEYYLIIPRYEDVDTRILFNDITSGGSTYFADLTNGKPFIVQGNISDIFPNITLEFKYQEEVYSYTPYISLKDGSFIVSDEGINITID